MKIASEASMVLTQSLGKPGWEGNFFTMSLHNDSPAKNLKRGSEPTWLAFKLTIIRSLLNRVSKLE
jgi:hypothetical protein